MPATTLPSPIALRPTSRIRVPEKTRPPSTASRSSPTTSLPSSTTFQPSSSVLLSPSAVSRSSSMTHCTPNSTANSYQGPSIPLPPPISLPQLFPNLIPQPSTRCSLKEQRVCQFIPPTPSSPRRRCSSLPPTLCQSKNCCGQQMLTSELNIPVMSNASHSSSSTSPLTPPQTPCSISLCSESRQQQLNIQSEHSKFSSSHTTPTAEYKGYESLATLGMLSMCSKTYHPCPDTQDKQIQTETLLLPRVPTVSEEDCLTSLAPDIMPTDSGLCPTQIPLNH